MGQDHSHDHVAGANARMLGWALAITATFLVVEVAGGCISTASPCCRTPVTC